MRLSEMTAPTNPNFAPGMAYWVSPRGEILDVTPGIHITAVVEHPEKFGYTEEQIKELYDKYGETVGSEGQAREEIMKNLFRKGWIRTRLYRREDTWSINIGRMTNKTYDLLQKWAEYHIGREDVKSGKFGDIKLSIGWDENMVTKKSNSIRDYAEGNIMEAIGLERNSNIKIRIVESAADFMGDYDLLTEASIGRAYQHLSNDEIPVAFITAFRGGQENYEENVRRNKHLAAQVKKAGYGYFFIDGGWIENQGTPEEVAVEEDTIFIVGRPADNGRLKGLLRQWIKQYDQDGALLKPEGDTDVYLLLNDGEEINLGNFSVGTAEEGYSRIRGRAFHFESVRRPEKNWISRISKR